MLTMNETPEQPRTSEYISDYEIAKELDVPLESVRRLLRRQGIPNVKIGQHRRIRRADFEAYKRKQLEGGEN